MKVNIRILQQDVNRLDRSSSASIPSSSEGRPLGHDQPSPEEDAEISWDEVKAAAMQRDLDDLKQVCCAPLAS